MKKGLVIFLSCLLTFCVYAQKASDFSWQFAFYDGNGTTLPFESASKPMAIPDGQQFCLNLQSDSDAYCYIVDEQPDGTACIVWNSRIKAGQMLNLPGKDRFFVLSPPDGTERFHIIVSCVRQKKLEKLLAGLKKNDTATVSRQVLDEIGRLRLAQVPFAEAPVKPAVMGATSRGMAPGSGSSATICSGASVYVETVRIKH